MKFYYNLSYNLLPSYFNYYLEVINNAFPCQYELRQIARPLIRPQRTRLYDNMVNILDNCIFDLCDWMRRNALKLNEDKTEFVIFRTKNNLRDNQCLVVGKDKLEVCEYVLNMYINESANHVYYRTFKVL